MFPMDGTIEIFKWIKRRLPPRDVRLLLQGIRDERQAELLLESDAYQRFLECEKEFWHAQYEMALAEKNNDVKELTTNTPPSLVPIKKNQYLLGHPHLVRELYKRSGIPDGDFWQWLQSSASGFDRALLPGAGLGNHGRLLIDQGICKEIVAIDLSHKTAQAMQAAYQQSNYNIQYLAADMNGLDAVELDYDYCFAAHAIHHVVALEKFFARVMNTLSRHSNHRFVFEEYVGPRYLEYPPDLMALAIKAFQNLPRHLRLDKDGTVIDRLRPKSRWFTQKFCPFESIRSDDIPEVFEQFFEVTDKFELGGGLITAVLENIIHNFDENDAEANDAIDELLEMDRQLSRTGRIPNFYLVASGRARKHFA